MTGPYHCIQMSLISTYILHKFIYKLFSTGQTSFRFILIMRRKVVVQTTSYIFNTSSYIFNTNSACYNESLPIQTLVHVKMSMYYITGETYNSLLGLLCTWIVIFFPSTDLYGQIIVMSTINSASIFSAIRVFRDGWGTAVCRAMSRFP